MLAFARLFRHSYKTNFQYAFVDHVGAQAWRMATKLRDSSHFCGESNEERWRVQRVQTNGIQSWRGANESIVDAILENFASHSWYWGNLRNKATALLARVHPMSSSRQAFHISKSWNQSWETYLIRNMTTTSKYVYDSSNCKPIMGCCHANLIFKITTTSKYYCDLPIWNQSWDEGRTGRQWIRYSTPEPRDFRNVTVSCSPNLKAQN